MSVAILQSSKALPWEGLCLEQRQHPAGEYSYPAFSTHLICLHQGPPSRVEHVGDSQNCTGLMSSGSIQIIPAGTTCTWRHNGTRFITLDLTPDLLQHIATDLHLNQIELLHNFNIHDPRIEHICLALLAELAAGGPSGRIYGEGLSTALAAHLLSTYSSQPQAPAEQLKGLPTPVLRRVVSMIEDRLAEDLGLAELASEAGLSISHFSSLFRLSTGLPPHRYIVQRRVERAQSLLQTTALPIEEVAITAGFYDQSHLTRQMHQVLGITPKYIREHLS